MQETRLFRHIQGFPGKVIVLVRTDVDVGFDRIGRTTFRPTGREMRVLNDRVRLDVFLDDLGVAPELGHETESDAAEA